MNVDFVRITASEMEQLKQLQTDYKQEIGEDRPVEEDFERLAAAMTNESIKFFGCLLEGKLIACCSISCTFSTFDYLPGGIFEDFYIMPKYRQRGIARKLVQYAYGQSGVSTLTVGCAACDVEMYRALGFGIPLGNMLAYGGSSASCIDLFAPIFRVV